MRIKCEKSNKEEIKMLKAFYEGQAGRKVCVFWSKGYYFVRACPVPKNPRTKAQQKHRRLFAKAGKATKALTAKEKRPYKRKAAKKKGWNWANVYAVEYFQKAKN